VLAGQPVAVGLLQPHVLSLLAHYLKTQKGGVVTKS
jgi:hypothetical protein